LREGENRRLVSTWPGSEQSLGCIGYLNRTADFRLTEHRLTEHSEFERTGTNDGRRSDLGVRGLPEK
jgi:hypothetical protein